MTLEQNGAKTKLTISSEHTSPEMYSEAWSIKLDELNELQFQNNNVQTPPPLPSKDAPSEIWRKYLEASERFRSAWLKRHDMALTVPSQSTSTEPVPRRRFSITKLELLARTSGSLTGEITAFTLTQQSLGDGLTPGKAVTLGLGAILGGQIGGTIYRRVRENRRIRRELFNQVRATR